MPDHPARRRLSRRYLLAAYLEHLPSTAGLVLAGTLYLVQPALWPGAWAWVVIGPLLAARLGEPLLRFAATSFTLDADALHLSTRLVGSRDRTLRWDDVRAVDVETPWAFRVVGVSRVIVAHGGHEGTRIELAGVDADTVAAVTRLAREQFVETDAAAPPALVGTAASPPAPAPAPAADGARIYRATIADLLVASLVYGQFAVIGAATGLAAWSLVDELGLAAAATGLLRLDPIVAAVAVTLVLIGAGFALTVVRYAGFDVRRDAGGGIHISYGLFARHSRRVGRRALAGVVLQQNPVEQLLGRTRLVLVTTDSTTQLGRNLVLPSLPAAVVAELIAQTAPAAFSAGIRPAAIASPRAAARSTVVALATLAPSAVICAFGASSGAPLAVVLLSAVAAWGLCYGVGRLLCSTLDVDPASGMVRADTRHITLRQRMLDPAAVHLVSTTAVLGRPVLTSAHYYAGMARVIVAVRFDPRSVDELARRLARNAAAVARRHRQRGDLLA